MDTILNVLALSFGWVPVAILLISGIHGISAKGLWKAFGIPSVGIFILVWIYAAAIGSPVASLIWWGIVVGIALTVALDVVRLTGVKLGTMPMDMPVSFGLRATGLFQEVRKRMMEKRKQLKMEMPEGLSMFGAAAMMKPVIAEVLNEKKARGKVLLIGYIWHFINGISFGLTYTLLFGTGHWIIALGWGITVWVLMMLVMPGLMNGTKITASTFFTALVAHLVMAVPIIFIPSVAISPLANESTLLAFFANIVGI